MKYRIEFVRVSGSKEHTMTEEFDFDSDQLAIDHYEERSRKMQTARDSGGFYCLDYPLRLRRIDQEEITTTISSSN